MTSVQANLAQGVATRRKPAKEWTVELLQSLQPFGRRRSGEPSRPNKPMVPTAHTSPAANPPRPLRRHIGQPLGSAQGGEQRPTKEQVVGHAQRTSGGRLRTTGSELGQRTARTAA